MTYEEALNYCYEHQDDYIRGFDSISEGQRQFDCLVFLLEDEAIQPNEISDYGMEGF